MSVTASLSGTLIRNVRGEANPTSIPSTAPLGEPSNDREYFRDGSFL